MGDRAHQDIVVFVEGLLEDPLTRMVMAADGVDREEMRELLFRASLASYPGRLDDRGAVDAPADYRPSVGVLVFNDRGQVLVGRRADMAHEAWQMPQGGIDPGETPREAVLRELREEIGTDNVEIVGEAGECLRYDLPEHLIGTTWGGAWRGQNQRWFAARFLGADEDIDLQTSHPEFSDWRWVPLSDLPALVVAFKREVYEQVVRTFDLSAHLRAPA